MGLQPLISRLSRSAQYSGILISSAAGIIMASWLLGFGNGPALDATMKLNTAVALLLGGFSLSVLALPSARLTPVARVAAVGVLLLGGLTLLEYVIGLDLGIDRRVSGQPADRFDLVPGRMSFAGAVMSTLLGLALLLMERQTGRGLAPTEFIAMVIVLVSSLAVIGYLYDGQELYHVKPYTAMALHTAALFLLAGVGLLCARPARGLMAIMTSDQIGGLIARRILPAIIIVPIVAHAIRLAGERSGWYGYGFGLALVTVVGTACFVALLLALAAPLNRKDAERGKAEAELREQARRLEEQARLLDLSPVQARNLQHEIILWTRGAEQLYGWSEDGGAREAFALSASHAISNASRTDHGLPVEPRVLGRGTHASHEDRRGAHRHEPLAPAS